MGNLKKRRIMFLTKKMLGMSNAILVRKLDIFPEIVPINFLECLATTVKKLGTYPETVKMKLEPTQKCFAIDAKKLGTWLETAKIPKNQDLTLEEVVSIDLLDAHPEDLQEELEDLGNQKLLVLGQTVCL